MADGEDSPVPAPTRRRLNERQLVAYESHMERLRKWMLNLGKQPETATGYAAGTVRCRMYRIDQFYRWIWDQRRFTTSATHDDADEYIQELAYTDESRTHKQNVVKAIKSLFKWAHYEQGGDLWDCDIQFYGGDGASQPRDFFTRDERSRLREAALSYGSVPHYNSLPSDDRREWKRLLAQRFGVPMSDVGRAEFDRANGYKVPSLVYTGLDAGLRPVEVKRSTLRWIDVDNAILRVPAEESAKGEEHWTVSLRQDTAELLRRWKEERAMYDVYAGSDSIWLTREGNPYESNSLCYLLLRLCDEAGIDTDHWEVSWYSIRHSVGTYMTREEDLTAAGSQLRHESPQTTMKYDNISIEDRRDALDRTG